MTMKQYLPSETNSASSRAAEAYTNLNSRLKKIPVLVKNVIAFDSSHLLGVYVSGGSDPNVFTLLRILVILIFSYHSILASENDQ